MSMLSSSKPGRCLKCVRIWAYIWYNNLRYSLKRYKHTTMDNCKLVSSQWSFRSPSAEPRTREPRPGVSNGAVLHCQMLGFKIKRLWDPTLMKTCPPKKREIDLLVLRNWNLSKMSPNIPFFRTSFFHLSLKWVLFIWGPSPHGG